MKLDVQVRGKTVAQLYRERDDYVMKYLPGTAETDFVSLAMPVRDEPCYMEIGRASCRERV